MEEKEKEEKEEKEKVYRESFYTRCKKILNKSNHSDNKGN